MTARLSVFRLTTSMSVKQASTLHLDIIFTNKKIQPETTGVYNPFDEVDVSRYFKGPLEAIPHKAWCDKHGLKLFENIPEDHPIIVLRPGERILAHTHEFVGIRAHGGACKVKSRSSWGT